MIIAHILTWITRRILTAWMLIDCGSKVNFISQHWVKKNLSESRSVSQKVQAVNGRNVISCGVHTLLIRADDSSGLDWKSVYEVEAIELAGYDFILSMPWLQTVNPDIDWATCVRCYHVMTSLNHIKLVSAVKCARLIKKARWFTSQSHMLYNVSTSIYQGLRGYLFREGGRCAYLKYGS